MRKLVKITFIVITALILLAGSAYVWLQSESGRKWLAGVIESAASSPGSIIKLERLEGSLEDIRLGNVTVSDQSGTWLTVSDIHLRWHILPALRGHYDIEVLEAKQVSLLRLPQGEESKKQKKAINLPDVALGKLHVDEILISESISGHAQRLSLDASGKEREYTLDIHTISGPETTLTAHIGLAAEHKVQAVLHEERGGIISALLKLPAENTLDAQMNAALNDKGIYTLKAAKITSGEAELQASGQYQPGGEADISAAWLNLPLEWLLPAQGLAQGQLQAKGPLNALNAQLSIQSPSGALSENQWQDAMIEAKGTLDIINPAYAGTLEGKAQINAQAATFSATLDCTQQGCKADTVSGMYGVYSVSGNGVLAKEQIQAELALASMPLSSLGIKEEGTLEGTLKLDGDYHAFAADISAKAKTAEANAEVTAKAQIQTSPLSFNGQMEASASRNALRLKITSDIKGDEKQAALSHITLNGAGVEGKGNLSFVYTDAFPAGDFQLAAADLKPLGSIIGQDLSGSAKLDAHISDDAMAITAEATALSAGQVTVDSLQAKASGKPADFSLAASMKGTQDSNAFTVKTGLNYVKKQEHILRLAQLDGTFKDAGFTLKTPGELRWDSEHWLVSPTKMAAAGGTILLQGKGNGDSVSALFKATGLNTALLHLPDGKADMQANIEGSPAAPYIQYRVKASFEEGDYPLLLTAKGNLKQGKLDTNALLTLSDEAHPANVSATASIPARFSLSPPQFAIDTQAQIKGNATVKASLEALNGFLRSGGQHVTGNADGSIAIAGTLSKPIFNGEIALKNGSYDHRESGVCLRDVSGELSGGLGNVKLTNLHASDSKGGSLQAQASLSLEEAKDLRGSALFKDFRLFCGGLASGNVDGKLALAGTLNAASIEGALTLLPMNVQLPGNNHDSAIPQVKIEYPYKEAAKAAAVNSPVTLDIKLNAPERFFVRGRGLDAEFAGSIVISGPVNQAQFNGIFTAKRGRFTLLDRNMTLTSASLQFDGPVPPSPFIHVMADSNSITAGGTPTVVHAQLEGPATKPDITITSDPPLPQDEALAMLLFGRQMNKLSPFQAASLAQSLRELAGFSSGPGLLGKVRNFLGVDTLNVDTGSSGGTSIGTGKYITDKVYVGVTQGTTPDSRAVTTEVEILPNITANTSVDATGQQGAGVQWKYDY